MRSATGATVAQAPAWLLGGVMPVGRKALTHLRQRKQAILTHCGDCGAGMACEARGGSLARDEGIVHCAVPAAAWWDNVVFT